MRKNPIQQKRGAMNAKPRIASATPVRAPAAPAAASLLPSAPPSPVTVVARSQLTAAVVETAQSPVDPVASSMAPQKFESPDVSSGQSDPYTLSAIFVALLSGAKRSEILPLLRAGYAKALERNDDLFIAIFEGGIAANLAQPDVSRATVAYHRAFDLCERRTDAPNGFLHSIVWSLYTNLEDNAEVAELMERARRNLKRADSPAERSNELLREAWIEFEALPAFAEQFEKYRTAQDKESTLTLNKLLRESRLDASKTLLLFPRDCRSRHSSDVKSLSSVVSQTCGNFFLWHNGHGTVINPGLTFVDNFYRIGGVFRDIHNIVFSAASSSRGDFLTQFRALLDLFQQANVRQSVRFLVHPNIVEEHRAEFQRLDHCRVAESIRSVHTGTVAELLGGGSLTFRNGSFSLSLEDRKLQFLERVTDDLESQAEELGDQHDLMVIPVETVEYLVWAAQQVRKRRPKLVIFELSKENNHLILFDAFVRDYVDSKTPIAYADSALIIDVLAEKFVDCVKAFAVSERDCWSENVRLAFDPCERQQPEGLLFFERGAESQFTDEHTEILEAFLYNRRCRRGLYFD